MSEKSVFWCLHWGANGGTLGLFLVQILLGANHLAGSQEVKSWSCDHCLSMVAASSTLTRTSMEEVLSVDTLYVPVESAVFDSHSLEAHNYSSTWAQWSCMHRQVQTSLVSINWARPFSSWSGIQYGRSQVSNMKGLKFISTLQNFLTAATSWPPLVHGPTPHTPSLPFCCQNGYNLFQKGHGHKFTATKVSDVIHL